MSNAIFRINLHKIICRNRLDAGSISATLAQHRNVSCAYDVSCYCYPCVVLFKTRIVQIFSLARFLKLKIAARQQYIEICNARRYWSMLVVNCVDIIRLKFVFFTVMLVIVLPIYWCFLLCTFYHKLECDILWMYLFYLTVSESDIIKLFNQSINIFHPPFIYIRP